MSMCSRRTRVVCRCACSVTRVERLGSSTPRREAPGGPRREHVVLGTRAEIAARHTCGVVTPRGRPRHAAWLLPPAWLAPASMPERPVPPRRASRSRSQCGLQLGLGGMPRLGVARPRSWLRDERSPRRTRSRRPRASALARPRQPHDSPDDEPRRHDGRSGAVRPSMWPSSVITAW